MYFRGTSPLHNLFTMYVMYRRKNLKNTQILQAALHCYQPLHCRMKGRFDKLCNNTAAASWCCLLATHHPESMQSSFRVEHFHMFSHVAAFDCFDSGCCWLGLIDDKSLLLTTHPSFQKYHWQHLIMIKCPKMNEYQNNILKKVICSPFFSLQFKVIHYHVIVNSIG